MGGPNSPAYARFRGLCGTAFVGLRKNFRVVGNLIGLMVEGGIPDIEIEPDKAVSKVCPPLSSFAGGPELTSWNQRCRINSCFI